MTTPDHYLLPDPTRLRDLADWLDATGKPDMAATVRRAAADLEKADIPAVHARPGSGPAL